MPVPKRKRSRARKKSRLANKGVEVKAITKCRNCQEPLMPHVACNKCGFYKGEKVLATKVDRQLKRAETRKAKAKETSRGQEQESSAPQE